MKVQNVAIVALAVVAAALLGVYGWVDSTGGDTRAFLNAVGALSVPTIVAGLLALARQVKEVKETADEVKETAEVVKEQTNGNVSRQHELMERLIDALEANGVSTRPALQEQEQHEARQAAAAARTAGEPSALDELPAVPTNPVGKHRASTWVTPGPDEAPRP